tara:strand:+ start:191 stop:598 length:408 start_codon:yes stop_codon:yes gene_type:complete
MKIIIPIIVVVEKIIPLAIPVNAQIEHIVTHIPDTLNVIKNHEKDFFISLNLLSFPAFLILRNKNIPSLNDQIIIKVDNAKLPRLIDSTVFDLKKIKRTDDIYDIVPVKSKNFSVWKKYEGTKISRWTRKINKTA